MRYGPNDMRRRRATSWHRMLRILAVGTATGILSLWCAVGEALAVTIDEFAAPEAPRGITAGPDGNLWFTVADDEDNNTSVARISTTGVVLGATAVPAGSGLDAITPGPDGNLWFTAPDRNRLGRVTTAGILLPEIALDNNAEPTGITQGPDGNMWFPEAGLGRIARRTTAGVSAGTTKLPGGHPADEITTGPDGALWFTEQGDNRIGRITTGGVVTEYQLPTPESAPFDIASGPDGALWFTETDGNRIGRIATSGAITEFTIPTLNSQPEGIVAGSDGNLWFTESGAAKVGRITPSGAITEFSTPTRTSTPSDITAGSDGRLWFTDNENSKIGRVTPDALPAPPAPTPPPPPPPPQPPVPPTPSGGPPSVHDARISGVEARSARLSVSINPNGLATSYYAECGRTKRYGRRFPAGSLPAQATDKKVAVPLRRLAPRTLYHCRVVASNSGGSVPGPDVRFTTDRALALSVAKLVVRPEGRPFRLRFRASAAARVRVAVRHRAGTSATASGVTRSVRAHRGRNSVRLPGLRRGRYVITISGRAGTARDRVKTRLQVSVSASPRFTG